MSENKQASAKNSIWDYLGITHEEYNKKTFDDPERLRCIVKNCGKRNAK